MLSRVCLIVQDLQRDGTRMTSRIRERDANAIGFSKKLVRGGNLEHAKKRSRSACEGVGTAVRLRERHQRKLFWKPL